MIPPTFDENTTLTVQRTFPALRERVFRAWTQPEALQRWFKPGGLTMTVSKLEAHVGGSFRFDLENGSSISGTYLHVVAPEKLVFTWFGELTRGKETLVTLDFLDQGSVTEVVLTHERLTTSEMRTMFGTGWPSLLIALSETLFPRLPADTQFD